MIFGISRANVLQEGGEQDNGFFIPEYTGGYIVGICVGILTTFVICLFLFLSWNCAIKENNYIIPKSSTLGLYIQLENGKLYKKQ